MKRVEIRGSRSVCCPGLRFEGEALDAGVEEQLHAVVRDGVEGIDLVDPDLMEESLVAHPPLGPGRRLLQPVGIADQAGEVIKVGLGGIAGFGKKLAASSSDWPGA